MDEARPGRDPTRILGFLAYMESGLVAVGLVATIAFFVVQYQTGSTQPYGTLSDLFGGLFSLVLVFLVLEIRRMGTVPVGPRGRSVFVIGLVAGVVGTIGSAFLMWGELGGPLPGAWRYLPGVGIAVQSVGFLVLICWCLMLGHLLKTAGHASALRWGIVGATLVGLPLWFAWIGWERCHLAPTTVAPR